MVIRLGLLNNNNHLIISVVKKSILLTTLALIAFFPSCSKKEEVLLDVRAPRFHAILEASEGSETRAYLDQSAHIHWKRDDRASFFFDRTYNHEYSFDGLTGDTAGDFVIVPSGSSPSTSLEIETGYNYSIYPYHKYNRCDPDGTLRVVFPAERTYNNEHKSSVGVNLAVVARDKADDELNEFFYKHVAGYFALKLYGDDVTIASVTLKSNNDEPLSGYPFVVFTSDDIPYLTFTEDSMGDNKATIKCDPPIKLATSANPEEVTQIWFTLPPTVLTRGFTFTVTDINGASFSRSYNSSYVIERKKLQSMAALKVVPEGGSDTPTVIPVTGVQIGSSSLALEPGGTANLMATVLPSNATDKSVSWSSNNTGVATVDNNGKVTAVAAGSAVITVTTTDGGKTATCTVTVTNPAVPVQSVSLNKTELSLNVGESETLMATVLPENADTKAVTWSSGNTAVATVDASGKVTAVAAGSAVITVTTTDGGKTATCTVTVANPAVPVQSVSLNETELSLNVGESATLTATVLPSNATDKGVSWSSSNTGVATVDNNGKVTAVAAGSSVITVTTTDGGKTATCTVTVIADKDPNHAGDPVEFEEGGDL